MIKKIINSLFGKAQERRIDLSSDGKPLFWSVKGWDFNFGQGDSGEFLNEAYAENPYFFMVIDKIASIASMLDRNFVYNDDSEREFTDQEVINLLNQPNKKDSNQEFYYRIFANLLTCGEVFIVGTKPIGFSRFADLWIPTVSNVTINESSMGEVLSYTVDYFDQSTTITELDTVLHIYKPDIVCDTNSGFSALNAARKVYQSNNEVWASEASLHKNKGISGVLYSDGNRVLEPKERQALQKQYDSEYTGRSNFGKVRVANTKLGYLQMGMNPNDLRSIETRIEHLRTACALFGVSSQLFGDVAGTTFNNMAEAKRAMYIDAVLPLAEKVDRELSKWLLNDNFGIDNVEIKVDRDEIEVLHEVNRELSEKVVKEFQAGLLSQEQALAILYPDLEVDINTNTNPQEDEPI